MSDSRLTIAGRLVLSLLIIYLASNSFIQARRAQVSSKTNNELLQQLKETEDKADKDRAFLLSALRDVAAQLPKGVTPAITPEQAEKRTGTTSRSNIRTSHSTTTTTSRQPSVSQPTTTTTQPQQTTTTTSTTLIPCLVRGITC